jgi:hypothetical protein
MNVGRTVIKKNISEIYNFSCSFLDKLSKRFSESFVLFCFVHPSKTVFAVQAQQ